jgi:hypothetical protein
MASEVRGAARPEYLENLKLLLKGDLSGKDAAYIGSTISAMAPYVTAAATLYVEVHPFPFASR